VGAPAAVATPVLVVRIEHRLAALPLGDVIETMRPLPIEAIAGAPAGVLGLAIVRGAPVPVLDLRVLLGLPAAPCARFVTARVAERCVAFAVDEVVGAREIAPGALAGLPPLLGEAQPELVTAMGALDRELLLVLRAGRRLLEAVGQVGAGA
jgi:purine-binding chemotaxis protein CheW